VLSFQAAYTGPVVMMSQNRQNEKDRLGAQNDYEINKKAEEEIEVILKHLVHQDHLILGTTQRIEGAQQGQHRDALAVKLDQVLLRLDQQDALLAELQAAMKARG